MEMQSDILLLIDKVAFNPRCTISHSASKSWMQGMKNAIIGSNNSNNNGPYDSTDLVDLTRGCLAAEQEHCLVGLVQVISCIELACKVDRYVASFALNDLH